MSTILLNAIISVTTGTISGLISGLVLYLIRRKRSAQHKPESLGKRLSKIQVFLIFFLLIAVPLFGLLFFIFNPDREIRIVGIDNQSPAAAEAGGNIGYSVQVKGYAVNWKGPVYVVVKPVNGRFWYVQPPAPVEFIGPGEVDWVGRAYFGSQSTGIGDSFVIFALATSSEYVSGQKLSIEPKGHKSGPVLLRRSH